ncbi:MAG TPA: pitrilysin family protein [Phycisphaerae bacterium]|nr:pitrilysin family protein [Phycisphaerae bacterium]
MKNKHARHPADRANLIDTWPDCVPASTASLRAWLCIAILLLLAVPARAQDVKYEKYKLENGMTVILHEDHALPVATINIWYYVGGKDEPPGRSGFAHLFEHLMFMGTRRVPGNKFDVIMEEGGGSNNASTSWDRTNYYSTGPSSLLPKLLWLDADRLEDLGREMTLEKLDKQREVVRNERRQTSEMQPYGRADLKVSELMYPPGHPYHLEVIGSHEDLQRATVQDVKDFFATFYVPNNASLVVAGDFDPAEIKPLVEKLFGTLPRDADARHAVAAPARLVEEKRVTFADRVQFSRLSLVYHSAGEFEAGDAEMDLAARILGSGKNSRLYKRLIYDDKIATDVSAYQASALLGSLFYVNVTAKPGVSLDQIEAATDEVLKEFIDKGPTTEELERQKAQIEYEMLTSLQSLLAKADALNKYNFFWGEPNGFKRDLDRYRRETVDSVLKAAREALTPSARLVMRVLSETDAGKPSGSADDVLAGRDESPGVAETKPFAPEAPNVFKLSNGVEVRHWERKELPLVYASLMLKAGALYSDLEKPGLAYLTASMLDEGTGKLNSIEFANALELLGASFGASADYETVEVDLSVLKRNLDKAMDLYAGAVLNPFMDEGEWARVHRLHLEDLRQSEDRASTVAARVGVGAYFGDDHPYGRPVNGGVESVDTITLADVKRTHAETYAPAGAIFFIAGDLTADEAKAALEKEFAGWKPSGDWKAPVAIAVEPPPSGSSRLVVVDKPGSVQTVIRYYMPGPKADDADRVRYDLLNTILGGSFTSRLNQNLREDKGYTYGARSSFTMARRLGYMSAAADVQAEVTGAALREFVKELTGIRTANVSADEARKAAETNRMDIVQGFQGLSGLIATAQDLEKKGRPFESLAADLKAIAAADAAGLNALANRAIPLDNAVLVLVGDRTIIEKQIKDLGLPRAEFRTTRGEILRSEAGSVTPVSSR